jgi:hypothetical protein
LGFLLIVNSSAAVREVPYSVQTSPQFHVVASQANWVQFNTKIIQMIQSKTLRLILNPPWYVSNKTLHEDLGVPYVEDEIKGSLQDTSTNSQLITVTKSGN